MGAFKARYLGRCRIGCGESIEPGQLVVHVEDILVHQECEGIARTAVARDERRPVCESCFIEKPCSCDDGQGPVTA